MIYAISGSGGFIGSHLSNRLSALEHTVLPISREMLYDPLALKQFFDEKKPDYILHLAAYGNHSNQEDTPMIVFSNIIGTFNMLAASKEVNYKKFVFVSTSSVYLPIQTYYSAAKASAENLAIAMRHQDKKPIKIVRPFSVYGPGEADFRFIPTVCRTLILGEELNLDEAPVHDWIYVDDFVDILLKNIDNEPDIDIGTGIGHSNGKIVEYLARITGKTIKTKRTSGMRSYDNIKWIALKGHKVKNPLNVGLEKTYKYYEKKYGN